MLPDEQKKAATFNKVIFELRERTLLEGKSFLLSSASNGDLPAGQSFYEYSGDRFTVEELTFSAAGDYGTKYIRMATAQEIATIKKANSYLYSYSEVGTLANAV